MGHGMLSVKLFLFILSTIKLNSWVQAQAAILQSCLTFYFYFNQKFETILQY